MEQEWLREDTQRPRSGAPVSEVRGSTGRRYPTPEAWGCGREEQPHLQGMVAAWVQEGLEELSHVEGQEGRL